MITGISVSLNAKWKHEYTHSSQNVNDMMDYLNAL